MEPPTKRYREDFHQVPPAHSQASEEPSRVLHVTELSPRVTEADLLEAFGHFGPINYTIVKRFRYILGLVEFEELESSIMCVTASANNAIFIAGKESVIAFSSLKEIPRHGFESSKPNHVLVLTVYNVNFAINAQTLKEICSPHGQILRIAIVKKGQTMTALVEFPSADVAKKVKQQINGADIYSGCCTLKVEYASVDHVRITVIDSDHVDFTVPKEPPAPTRKTLIQGPPPPAAEPADRSYGAGSGGRGAPEAPVYASRRDPYGREAYPPPPPPPSDYHRDPYGRILPPPPPRDSPSDHYDREPANLPAYSRGPAPHPRNSPTNRGAPVGYGYGGAEEDRYGRHEAARDPYARGHLMRTPGVPLNGPAPKHEHYGGGDVDGSMLRGGQGCVIMLYGVDQERMNCDKLFNVFCQYGNMLRILFMKNKQNTAIFEMGSPEQARTLIQNLNGMMMFGARLEFKVSFQDIVKTVRDPFPLGDGSPSFRDYTQSRNQRFLNLSAADRNRPCPPQAVLHWFNAPPEMDGEKISEMFEQRGAARPINTYVFPSKTGRSASGTAEFATVEDAIDAQALANHTPVSSEAGKNPFIVKISFTTSRAPGTRHFGGDRTRDPNFSAAHAAKDSSAHAGGDGPY